MNGYEQFCECESRVKFQNILDKISRDIDRLENDYIINIDIQELECHFIKEATLDPLRLHVDQRVIEHSEGVNINVSRHHRFDGFTGDPIMVRGTKLKIGIPFEGELLLWTLRPSHCAPGGYPFFFVLADRIVLSVEFPDADTNEEHLRQEIIEKISLITDAVDTLRRDVEIHNSKAPAEIKVWIAAKRKKAETALGVVGALGIPLKRRDVPATLAVPVQRKSLVLSRPTVSPAPFSPEPFLQEAVYDDILKSLRAMSLVIERNPYSFQKLGEEAIRDHFLINLNCWFEGQATGETFNGDGKTDILIRANDRNVFIAECKIWSGPAKFGEAIDQLLRYLSWRDCKCALLVFNRNRDSTGVLYKMHEVMTQRKEHQKKSSSTLDEGGRYVLVKESEPGREIIVSTLLFDVPAIA